jgi:hypothetical protein
MTDVFPLAAFSLAVAPFLFFHWSSLNLSSFFHALFHPTNWVVFYVLFLPSILLRGVSNESIAAGLLVALFVNMISQYPGKIYVVVQLYLFSVLLVLLWEQQPANF